MPSTIVGTEICGWVEVKKRSWWTGVVKLEHLLDIRNRTAFECLFLADADTTGFHPIAPERGVPVDASQEARASVQEWGEAVKWPSWVTWTELSAMDWDEVAPGYHGYGRLFGARSR